MLKFLKDQWSAHLAFKSLQKNPILMATFRQVSETLGDRSQGLGKHWSENGKQRLLKDLMTVTIDLLAQQNPAQAVRMAIINQMSSTAKFDVLVMQPPPPFKGLTGELKPYIPQLAKKDDELKKYLYNSEPYPTGFDEMWDLVLMTYWMLHLGLSTLNIARIGLGDRDEDRTKDWFKPCYTSMCIWHEHLYREDLGLPSAIEGENYDVIALMHSTWFQRAEEGHKDLRLAWERSWEEILHEPSPYTGLAM